MTTLTFWLFPSSGFVQQNKKKMLPVITQGDSYSSDIAQSECDNQISLSPTSVKEERIKFKKKLCL